MQKQDYLTFGAGWKSPPMQAYEVIHTLKDFLWELTKISPWEPPFDLSGTSAGQSHVLIRGDWSNFEEVAYHCIADRNTRYINECSSEDFTLQPNSKTMFGFSGTFSDYSKHRVKRNMITVSFNMGSSDDSYGNSISIRVPQYQVGQLNMAWAMNDAEIPEAIFDLMIDFFQPDSCHIQSSKFGDWLFGSDVLARKDFYEIGWLSYTKNQAVMNLLAKDSQTHNYKEGMLIKFGENISVFEDPATREEVVRLRDKLRKNNLLCW